MIKIISYYIRREVVHRSYLWLPRASQNTCILLRGFWQYHRI